MAASMPPLEIKRQVARILECALTVIEPQDGQDSDLVWDSLVHVELMVFLEQTGLLEVTEETMTTYSEIGALRCLLKGSSTG